MLLRAIASRPQTGWRTSDLCRHCGLDEGTARRILKRLVRERAVTQGASDRRYRPGPLLFELGLSVDQSHAFQQNCQASLDRIARDRGGVALLYQRSGDEFVCIGRAGRASSAWLAVSVGTRRSLGLSAGGMAIVLALPPAEREAMLARCEEHARGRGELYLQYFHRILARSREYDAGVNIGDGLQGVSALAVALHDGDGVPFASLGLSAPQEDLPLEQVPDVLSLLAAEARTIENDLPMSRRSPDP